MDDFAALAKDLAGGVGDARGSLILSRDGLVLGAHPEEAESLLKPAWLRLASMGEPERGFVQFGAETWCYVRRGPYAAFVVVGTGVRPGVAIDRMEQTLLAAEEARVKRQGARAQESPASLSTAPTSKPRTSLHPDPRPAEPSVVISVEPTSNTAPSSEDRTSLAEASPASIPPVSPAGADDTDPASSVTNPSEAIQTEGTEPPRPGTAPHLGNDGAWVGASEGDDEEGGEVDRFSLAREFSQLLQEDQDPADG